MAQQEVFYEPSARTELYDHEAGYLLFVVRRFLIRYYWGIYYTRRSYISVGGWRGVVYEECEEH